LGGKDSFAFSNRKDSVSSDSSEYEVVGIKEGNRNNDLTDLIDKVFKKYRMTNLWAIAILATAAIDYNYFQLTFPWKLNPWGVIAFVLFNMIASLIASYFL
jgi:hypothetical protein